MSREASSNVRYELLTSTNEVKLEDQPPSYEEANIDGQGSSNDSNGQSSENTEHSNHDKKETFIPPSYEAATTLPTYEDVQKHREAEARDELVNLFFNVRNDEGEDNELRVGGMPIGNDCLFFFAYIVAFVFNWIGLFIGYFIMYSWAGRYGSIAGFGTSLMKWLIFLKYSTCCEDYYLNLHEYLWWIFCFIAFTLFLKGMICWLNMRKLQHVNSENTDESRDYVLLH